MGEYMYLKTFIKGQFTFHYAQIDEIMRDATDEQFQFSEAMITLLSHNNLHTGEIAALKGVRGSKGLVY
jgi:hypothetical protein